MTMKPRILIAEDTKDSRDYLVMALRRDFQVDAVTDGTHALQWYRDALQAGRPYGLLVLDVAMPGIIGFEVAEQIRDGGDDATPIVFLTAYAEPETMGRARRSHAEVWAKPILENDLVERVRGVLDAS